jgi:hypothetical protein
LNPGTHRFVVVFSVFVIFCHWTSCVWLFVGELERDDGTTTDWMAPSFILSSSLGSQWLYAFFWALSCSLGVGCAHGWWHCTRLSTRCARNNVRACCLCAAAAAWISTPRRRRRRSTQSRSACAVRSCGHLSSPPPPRCSQAWIRARRGRETRRRCLRRPRSNSGCTARHPHSRSHSRAAAPLCAV